MKLPARPVIDRLFDKFELTRAASLRHLHRTQKIGASA